MLNHMERAFEIGINHTVEILLLHLEDQAVAGNAGVVYQNIHAAEILEHLLGRAANVSSKLETSQR